MDKDTLRNYIKKQRDMMDTSERSALSETIMEKIINLKNYKNAETIMCFASFGSEVDTFPLLDCVLSSGKKLVLPRVEKCNNENALGLYKVLSIEDQLVKGVFGIMEPNPEECEKADLSEIELCICPGVVFDKKCNRIGYGGGYYDRLLKNKNAKYQKVGISFDLQVVETIETDIFDISMDMVITEKGVYLA